ncbi:ABC-F family ATP-binding cassette domain-containing protein [Staphylococcus pseudintermedius]|nr:ABC-F family ATP-binding cassette domain-containing protein [Staphylococcus pseudintermedius]EGQ0295256.1 ABC-F family ATP-binding cassette domain-containing protein [Staphylococcus pseudintermedius]EGQ1741025.1 ABC transporter ATP-binding protein [Staphylococcus pseudintermedius]EGQ1760309.1 ABC transporter ATP-binding protein [Staphylococcus pseudintermedius]EIM5222771.1 ABC-F family ATP-binding cassette domain-containing protein [Staphylococcus pseudintermedius]
MNIVNVSQLTKSYNGNKVFDHIKFEVNQNDRIGLIGRNGEGKTTLFKLIAKKEQADEGFISIAKDVKVGLLAQIPNLPPDAIVINQLYQAFDTLNGIEQRMRQLEIKMVEGADDINQILKQYDRLQNEFETLGGYDRDYKIDIVLNGLKIAHLKTQQWSNLSGGMQTKVGLAMLLLQSPELLLLDEPTNHLDIESIEWLTKFIQQYKGAVMVISHDRYFLDETVTQILEIDQQQLYVYPGHYSNFVIEKEKRILNEFKAYQTQQKKIQKMKAQIKQLKIWANQAKPPNASMHRRAKSMEKALARIEVKPKPRLAYNKMKLDIAQSESASKDIFVLKDVAKMYDDILFEGVNMKIRRRDKVAIVGANGTGKSTLLKLLLREIVPDEGHVQIAETNRIGYLAQHQFNTGEMSVLETFRQYAHVSEGEARNHLAKYLFYGYDVYKKVKDLSGGEKMRLRWAQMISQQFNVLILDEPTNHLDIDAKEALEEALEDFDGTVIAVSHDRYFLDKHFSKTYWIDNKQLHYYPGHYSYAKQKRYSEARQKTN